MESLLIQDTLSSEVTILKLIRISLFLFAVFSSYQASARDTDLLNAKFQVQGAKIDVSFAPGTSELSLNRAQLLNWIEKAAHAVADYYQGFPVSSLNITINPRSGSRIGGQAFSGEKPMVLITVGKQAQLFHLEKDWVLVHEMVHLAFPSVYRKHHWIQEGLATYIEPIVRVRAGLMTEKEAWHWMLTGMPKGLPESKDKGLDNTNTWGRRYWGGALFSLLADQRIREQSHSRYDIGDALRGIVNAGYNMQSDDLWPLDKILTIGDKATKTNALISLYNEHKDTPIHTGLQKMWIRLGVRLEDGKVKFNDNSPQANLRHALLFGSLKDKKTNN